MPTLFWFIVAAVFGEELSLTVLLARVVLVDVTFAVAIYRSGYSCCGVLRPFLFEAALTALFDVALASAILCF